MAAKYTLYHNNRERLNSYNYVRTLYVNMLNHTHPRTEPSRREPGANREENELVARY